MWRRTAGCHPQPGRAAGPRRLPRCLTVVWASVLIVASMAGPATALTEREANNMLARGQRYERHNRPDLALDLYRQIWQALPSRYDALLRGSRILMDRNRYAEASDWLRRAVAVSPETHDLWVGYGAALDATGRHDRADSAWSAGATNSRDRSKFYLGVVDYLLEVDSPDRAREWALLGIANGAGVAHLTRRMFDAELVAGNLAGAVRYASDYSAADAARAHEVVEAIEALESGGATLDSLVDIAARASALDTSSAGRAIFLGAMALLSANHELASSSYLRAGRHWQEGPRALSEIAGRLESAGHRSIAAHLYSRAANTMPRGRWSARSAARGAAIFEEQGDLDRTEPLYRWLVANGSRGQSNAAKLSLARLLLAKGLVDDARALCSEAIRRGGSRKFRRSVEYIVADCEIQGGDFAGARDILRRLAGERAFGDASRATLRLAEVAMYDGKAAEMSEICATLLRESPGSYEANDCLRLRAVLTDARRDTSAWQTYGRATYLLSSGRPHTAATLAADMSGTPLDGHAMLLTAGALAAMADFEAAAMRLGEASEVHAGTPIGEEAQWRLGGLLLERLHDASRALSAYEALVSGYPQSVYLGPARRIVRDLRARKGST